MQGISLSLGMFYSQAWLSKINDDPWGMQATKAEYSNYFSVMWKIQPLSQEQKKNPAEEFFTSPKTSANNLYPKIPVLALGWCFASSLLQHLDDPNFWDSLPKKAL